MIKLRKLVEQEIQYKIYCDMDGVLTDFERMFQEIKGITPDEFRNNHPEDTDESKFWFIIDTEGGLNFWSHMYWMPDGRMLWDYIKNKNTEILSAPPKRISQAELGKKLWCRRFLGKNTIVNLARRGEKRKFADKNSILIDDTPKTIAEWESDGGIGILHKNASETIGSLKELGIN